MLMDPTGHVCIHLNPIGFQGKISTCSSQTGAGTERVLNQDQAPRLERGLGTASLPMALDRLISSHMAGCGE